MKFIATFMHHRKLFKHLDLLLIGGGGILQDLYRNNAFVFGIYGLQKWTKTPAAIFGAGAGPLETFIGKQLIKMVANSVNMINVRDHASEQLLKSIGVKKPINIIMDPAFYLPFQEKQQKNSQAIKIGVTAITYFHGSYLPTNDDEKYNAYIQGMAKNLDSILDQEPLAQVQFFSTKHPYDTNTTKDIRNLMKHKDRAAVCDQMLTHQEIIQLIAEQDLVIGTRLHSLILSIVAKTPIIAVGYQKKVMEVMESVGCKEYSLTIEEVSAHPQCMLPIYEAMNLNWEPTLDKFNELVEHIIQESPDGMDLIKKVTKP